MRRKIPSEIREQIKTAYASGMGLREIARSTGIPAGTILSMAKREGWTQQIQNAKALAKREDAILVAPVEAVAKSMQQRGERHLERMAGVSERGVDHIETMDGPGILRSIDEIEKLDKLARRNFGLKDDNPYIGFSLNVLNLGTFGVEVRDDSGNPLRSDWLPLGNQLQSGDAIKDDFFRQNSHFDTGVACFLRSVFPLRNKGDALLKWPRPGQAEKY